ncbi:hypothetical protein DFS34DRAFT_653243 [Phlyctochytrium arcticum]|nr:hypothetical protein DFS34DRAFT_653243 [Phlyctochytrium arcticum]
MEAEGNIISHWDRFASSLVKNHALVKKGRDFWTDLWKSSSKYFKSNHLGALPVFTTFLTWKYAFSGEVKQRFFVPSTYFLAEFVPESLYRQWNLGKKHVRWVTNAQQHTITSAEVNEMESLTREYHAEFYNIYQAVAIVVSSWHMLMSRSENIVGAKLSGLMLHSVAAENESVLNMRESKTNSVGRVEVGIAILAEMTGYLKHGLYRGGKFWTNLATAIFTSPLNRVDQPLSLTGLQALGSDFLVQLSRDNDGRITGYDECPTDDFGPGQHS